jgi:signal transduction histidine kinase
MLAVFLLVLLVLAVAVLMVVDLARTPTESPRAHTDSQVRGTERPAFVPSPSAGARTFSLEPATGTTAIPAPDQGLPAPEMDRAALAFDRMHREMSRSAADEAALRDRLNAVYVNLSHRNQALAERQLRLIQHLEQSERDELRLADLSRMNRIAMRMYRNAQNLLVLAGHDSSARWTQPVTLAHLVEAALSEIEGSERVSFDIQPDIAVRGPAVNDVVHLLEELTENATSFSAAGMPVHITGRMLNTGGALIDITDQGIGMAVQELAYTNHQLENPPAMDADVHKSMGLLVVARLAARHGIRVRLNQAEFGGLTALVWFPDEVLTRPGVAADRGHAVPEQRETLARPHRLASAQVDARGAADPRREPAWPARGPRHTASGELPAAVRLSGSRASGAPGSDAEVIVPRAQNLATTRGLPIFDDIESRWSRGASMPPAAGDSAQNES